MRTAKNILLVKTINVALPAHSQTTCNIIHDIHINGTPRTILESHQTHVAEVAP